MSAKEVIIDYAEKATEIDKWIALKGEKKYLRFAEILSSQGYSVNWQSVKDLYRYDKRLLINVFKYLSFFEEFLRALIWNLGDETYRNLEKAYLPGIMNDIIKKKTEINYVGFSVDTLELNKKSINYLRRRVAHNKIILEGEGKISASQLLKSLSDTLPLSYKTGFKSDINNCKSDLSFPSKLMIVL